MLNVPMRERTTPKSVAKVRISIQTECKPPNKNHDNKSILFFLRFFNAKNRHFRLQLLSFHGFIA
jgi:hypothetical protein